MISIAISTTIRDGGEYAQAVASSGAQPRLLDFDVESIDAQLEMQSGVLLSGGGDVDPARYGAPADHAAEIDARRDRFEIALVRRARERGLPTLCICRGLQVANVAFGGTLVPDIGTVFDPATAGLHRRLVDGQADRGLIAGHQVSVAPDSLLARIVGNSAIVTGSRHHQSIDVVAGDLAVVASTSDTIVEAVEARFGSPFWLAVQWHPESTLEIDDGVSRSIFAAFAAAAARFGETYVTEER